MNSTARYLPLLLLIVGLSGCKKSKKTLRPNKSKNNKVTQLNIPVSQGTTTVAADESISNFFDQDIEKFVSCAQEETHKNNTTQHAQSKNALPDDTKDFTWLRDAVDTKQEFKTVYFDFDSQTIREDQKKIVAQDATNAQNILAEARKNNTQPTIVIEGHACRSAGSSPYNLALSEDRAKQVADWFVSQNVPRENIKIVGRGFEMPAIIDGKAIEGSKEQQWANRRVEVHVLYS